MRHYRWWLKLDRFRAEETLACYSIKITAVRVTSTRHNGVEFSRINVEVSRRRSSLVYRLVEYKFGCERAWLLNLSAPFSDAGCKVFACRGRWNEVQAFWGICCCAQYGKERNKRNVISDKKNQNFLPTTSTFAFLCKLKWNENIEKTVLRVINRLTNV